MRKQRVLLEHEPHGPSVRRPRNAGIRVRPGVATGLHAAMRGPGEAGDRAQDRRLAAARRPEDREHLARVATEFDVERESDRPGEGSRRGGGQPRREPTCRDSIVVVISVTTATTSSVAAMMPALRSSNACMRS